MHSPDREDDSNSPDQSTSETPAETLAEKKAKLRKDIQELKELNFLMESRLNICKFGNIKHLLKTPEPDPRSRSKRIPDVEAEYTDELFKLAGMRCTKFVKDEYVFNFYPPGKRIGHVSYAVQIINASGKPTIGKWVMPMGIDLDHTLQETPLNNAMDIKPFLGSCKHYIDCYTNRLQQYNELQSVLNELSGCYLNTARLGYLLITLKFLGMRDLAAEESYNINIYLTYEPNRVRPHMIKIEECNGKTLTDSTVNKLKTYFKYFKCYNLKKAFEETVAQEDTPVVWKNQEDPDALDLSDSSTSSSEMNFFTRKRKTKSKSSRPGVKRKETEISLQNDESENEAERSDESESGRADDRRLSLSRSVKQRGQKSAGKKGKVTASKKKQIKAAGPKSAARTPKKKSKLQKSPEKNAQPSTSGANTNLRQSTLRFVEGSSQIRRPGRANRTELDKDVTLSEKRPTTGTSVAMKQKSKSDGTLLENREFGTSTPVSRLRKQQKQFSSRKSTEVSPIKKKNNNQLEKR